MRLKIARVRITAAMARKLWIWMAGLASKRGDSDMRILRCVFSALHAKVTGQAPSGLAWIAVLLREMR